MKNKKDGKSMSGQRSVPPGLSDSLQKELLNLFSELFDQAPFGYITLDQEGRIMLFNVAACTMLGIAGSELNGRVFRSILDPADHPRFDQALTEIFRAHQKVVFEFYLPKMEATRYFRAEMTKIKGEEICKVAIVDISEKHHAEEAIIESERKYRNLHTSMMDGFVFTDMNGQIRDSNKSYQDMLGYTDEELKELTYINLTPEKWHSFEQIIIREQILTGGHSVVYHKEYIKKDGTVFPVELRTYLVRDALGDPEGMWAIVRDITERMQTEEALRSSEEKFRSIVESSPTAMHLYCLRDDGELELTGANPSADRILGIEHAQLFGRTIKDAFPSLKDTGIPGLYHRVATGEFGPQTFETPYTDNRITGIYQVHVFRTGPRDIAVDFIDITQRRQMEEAIRRSADQKEVLLREIHHRVKNNLAIVISLLNFQLRNITDETMVRIIVDIQTRIRSMALIHENLYRSETLDRIPLAAYLESLVRMIITTFSGHRITLDSRLDPVDVSIESALPLGLIVNELLTNAFKYAFPDGRQGTVLLSLSSDANGHCDLMVEDDGIGLPETSTLQSEKSLGLYIVGLLVDQLEGSVDIVRGKGTSFRIHFFNAMSQKQ